MIHDVQGTMQLESTTSRLERVPVKRGIKKLSGAKSLFALARQTVPMRKGSTKGFADIQRQGFVID